MKTLEEIKAARAKLCDRIQSEKVLTHTQYALLAGMLNALVWVAEGPDCSTIQDVLDGRPMSPR